MSSDEFTNYDKNKYKVLRGYQKMKPSEFVEYVFDIKLFAYQKVFIDAFADKKKFYFPIYGRGRIG